MGRDVMGCVTEPSRCGANGAVFLLLRRRSRLLSAPRLLASSSLLRPAIPQLISIHGTLDRRLRCSEGAAGTEL